MDWSGCELVEIVQNGTSSVVLVRGTSIFADNLLADLECGMRLEEIAERYPNIPSDSIKGLLTYAVERIAWDVKTLVDWHGCALVEQVAGRCSGAPTIRNTRIPPDLIAEYFWSGATVAQIQEDYPGLSEETIHGLIDHVRSQEASAA